MPRRVTRKAFDVIGCLQRSAKELHTMFHDRQLPFSVEERRAIGQAKFALERRLERLSGK